MWSLTTGTKPRSSTFTPAASRPRPAPFGRRPTATSTRSAAITSCLPSTSCTVTSVPFFVAFWLTTLLDVRMRMPRFSSALRSSFPASASVAPAMCGSISTTVTSLPSEE